MEHSEEKQYLRSKVQVPLIGPVLIEFNKNRIPTKREALQVMFFYNYVKHFTISMSINEVACQIIQLKIDGQVMKRKDVIQTCLHRLYNGWRDTQRSKSKTSLTVEANRQIFVTKLSDPLPCAIPFSDNTTKNDEMRDKENIEKILKRNPTEGEKVKKPFVKKLNLTTPKVAAAFERTGISNRNASMILEAIIEDNHTKSSSTTEYSINYQTIRRSRMQHRHELAEQLKQSFDPSVPLVIHWDGKMLPDQNGKRVDRLPIVVTGSGVSKLLSVPTVSSGTASAETDAIIEVINEWGLQERLVGMSFDTTSVNTGVKTGIISRLPKLLNKNMLPLACRHHVAEVVLKHVFELFGDKSKSSNLDSFSEFKKEFNENRTGRKLRTVLDDPQLKSLTEPWRDATIEFCQAQLSVKQQRGDYEELLELVIMFLGGVPPKGIKFRKAGCLSRARWMGRSIYLLKLWISSDPIEDQKLWKHYTTVALFISQCFIKYWYRLNSAASAPRVDLEFSNDCYKFYERSYGSVALKAFKNHLWYLSEWNVAMAFFDPTIDNNEKKRMVAALNNPPKLMERKTKRRKTEEYHGKVPVKAVDVTENSSVSQFITEASKTFFNIMNIQTGFFAIEPADWEKNQDFLQGKDRVCALQVTNDVAERAVKLATDFNNKITKDPRQHNELLQVVEHHRSLKPQKY